MNQSTTLSTQDAALDCIQRGFCPVPFPRGAKGPTIVGWTEWRFTTDEVPDRFRPDDNIGIRLGDDVGRLICVDLDCDEALDLAPEYLMPTPAVLGRPGRPRSHWLYRVTTDGGHGRSLRDRLTNSAMVEVLYNGRQVVVGPSVHPIEGDVYDTLDFTLDDVPVMPRRSLDACVEALHEACLQQRYADDPQKLEQARNGRASQASTPAQPPAVPDDPDSVPYEQRLRRGEAYAANTPGAISGSGGHNQTYGLATALVWGLCLNPDDARSILSDYNARCEPPWSERELDHKINEAATKPHEKPRGWLLANEACTHSAPLADVSGITAQMDEPADEPPEPATDHFPHPGAFPRKLLDQAPGIFHVALKYYRTISFEYLPIAFLASFLTAVGCVLGRRVRNRSGTRTNLYALSLVGTGGGKEATREVIQHLFQWAGEEGPNAEIARMTGHEDFSSDTSIYSALKLQNPILFQIDEFGLFMQAVGSSSRTAPHLHNVNSALLKLYSKSRTVFRPKAYADPRRNIEIVQPHVCLYGTSVASNFWTAMDRDKVEGGFLPRMLIFENTEAEHGEATEVDPPETVLHFLRKLYSIPCGLAHNQPVPTLLETTADAQALLDEYRDTARSQLDESKRVTCLWTRAAENATKVAMIHACMRDWMGNFAAGDLPVIDAASADWGIRLVDYLVRLAMHRCYWHIVGGEFDRLCKEIVTYLRTCDGRQQRFSELSNVFGNVSPRHWLEVRASLETKRLVSVEFPKTGRRGRPPEVWRLRL